MPAPSSAPNPWAELAQGLELTDVKVTAALRRDVIREELGRVVCTEGRLYTFKFLPDGELRTLDYNFSFQVPGGGGQIPAAMMPARLELRGYHAGGWLLEISGGGWIGYDDRGHLGGRFEMPPAIVTRECAAQETEPTCQIIEFPHRLRAQRA